MEYNKEYNFNSAYIETTEPIKDHEQNLPIKDEESEIDDSENPISFNKNEFGFVALIMNILEQIPYIENPQDIAKMIARLNEKFAYCQTVIEELDGLEIEREEQLKQLEKSKETLDKKRLQLESYKRLDVFKKINSNEFQEIINKMQS